MCKKSKVQPGESYAVFPVCILILAERNSRGYLQPQPELPADCKRQEGYRAQEGGNGALRMTLSS